MTGTNQDCKVGTFYIHHCISNRWSMFWIWILPKKKNKFKCIVAFISLFHTHTHTHTLFISHTFHQDPVNSWMIYAHIDEMMQNQLHLFCKLDKISHVAWIPFVYDFQFHDTNCSHWLPWFGIHNPVWFVQWRMVFIVVILVTSVFFIVVSIRAFTTIIIIILPFSFNSKQGTISPEKRMNRINRFSRFILCNFPYQSCLNLRSEPKTVSKMASKYLCANVSSSMRLLFSRAIKRPALQVQIKKWTIMFQLLRKSYNVWMMSAARSSLGSEDATASAKNEVVVTFTVPRWIM